MIDTSLRLRRGIEAIPGLHVLGDPAMYVWGFGSDAIDAMAVADAMEATFNEVYDTEHAPMLVAVPGVVRSSRYRNPSPTHPRYIAAYALESPAVLQSAEWKTAGKAGRWAKEIRRTR